MNTEYLVNFPLKQIKWWCRESDPLSAYLWLEIWPSNSNCLEKQLVHEPNTGVVVEYEQPIIEHRLIHRPKVSQLRNEAGTEDVPASVIECMVVELVISQSRHGEFLWPAKKRRGRTNQAIVIIYLTFHVARLWLAASWLVSFKPLRNKLNTRQVSPADPMDNTRMGTAVSSRFETYGSNARRATESGYGSGIECKLSWRKSSSQMLM